MVESRTAGVDHVVWEGERMKALIQRVSEANVTVRGERIAEVGRGSSFCCASSTATAPARPS